MEEKLLAERFDSIKKSFSESDIRALKTIGSELASEALVENDSFLVEVSLVPYSLAKFLEKPYILSHSGWGKFREEIERELGQCASLLQQRKKAECMELLGTIFSRINEVSTNLGRFSTSVLEKARVKAAAQIYAHGASLGRAAELAGVEKSAAAKYIGVTRLHEKYKSLGVRARLEKARELFG